MEKIEIIVVDDGSTDNTMELLNDFIQNRQIKYYFQKNKGKACATRIAIEFSIGKYIFNLDADDYYYPTKIIESVKLFEANENLVHVASPAHFIHENAGVSSIEEIPKNLIGKLIEGNFLLQSFYSTNILYGGGSTFAGKANLLKKILIPDGVDMYIDEFLILALLPFGQSYFIGAPQSVWRVHVSNYSGKTNEKQKHIEKAKRLVESSAFVLKYLEENSSDKNLIKIYQVKDAIRKISYKELLHSKSPKDIYQYAKKIFFVIKPGWKIIRMYDVLNRLIPTPVIHLLKKIRN